MIATAVTALFPSARGTWTVKSVPTTAAGRLFTFTVDAGSPTVPFTIAVPTFVNVRFGGEVIFTVALVPPTNENRSRSDLVRVILPTTPAETCKRHWSWVAP